MSEKPTKYKTKRFQREPEFFTTEERSKLMQKIRNKNTKPEIALRTLLWAAGCRYRKNDKTLPGTPDISMKKYKLVIFVDGEFWHGHNWEEKKKKIKSNKAYWIPKIERNMVRDKENNAKLEYLGYKVFRFWGGEIKKNPGSCLMEVLRYISDYENLLR